MAKRNRNTKSKTVQRAERQQYLIYSSIILIILVLVAYVAYTIITAPPEVAEARLQEEAFIGQQNAPVEVIEYGAYGCYSCRYVHQSGVLQQVLDRYGDQIQLKFRNWPVISPTNDPLAAEAAQCVLDQGTGAFWTYHNALFDLSNSEYSQHQHTEDFVALADEVGLDADAVQSCLDSNTHERTVQYWKNYAERNQMRVTPTFFVNGQRLNDATQLETAVESALGVN